MQRRCEALSWPGVPPWSREEAQAEAETQTHLSLDPTHCRVGGDASALRAMELPTSEMAEQRWPETWTPCHDYIDYLRMGNIRALQGAFLAGWNVSNGPPEMLMSLW